MQIAESFALPKRRRKRGDIEKKEEKEKHEQTRRQKRTKKKIQARRDPKEVER